MANTLFIGTGGLAKQCLSTIRNLDRSYGSKFFYANNEESEYKFGFKVLNDNTLNERINDFSYYSILVGNPKWRKHFHVIMKRYKNIGPINLWADSCDIQETNVGIGCIFLGNSLLESYSTIGSYVLVNYGAQIHHDVIVGDYSEICPGAKLLGGCSIGNETSIGANAVILPGVSVGNNCTVGAGAVVTKDIPDNKIIKGVPAK